MQRRPPLSKLNPTIQNDERDLIHGGSKVNIFWINFCLDVGLVDRNRCMTHNTRSVIIPEVDTISYDF